MEILSRILRGIHKRNQVSYHPKCGRLGLNHLIFADDLMILVRGDTPSVAAVTHSLDYFAKVSGLQANPEKTNIYMGGVREDVKQEILRTTGYMEGTFPFIYLGVPLNEGKLNKSMFADLLTKVQQTLHHWSTQTLSYAGKISLLNTVIFGLEQFWCSTLLIPKGVIKMITKFCRNFLWNTDEGTKKMVMKIWVTCCKPVHEGGFNIKEVLAWNKCLICKWIWDIDQNSDSSWAAWNYLYNIKTDSFWTMIPKNYHAESWKSILKVRDDLLQKHGTVAAVQAVLQSCVKKGKLCLSLVYDQIRDKEEKVRWGRMVWIRTVLPKHSVIMTLALQRKLATVDQLNKKGMVLVNRCVLCKAALETHKHLFFNCSYSATIWLQLLQWMRILGRSNQLREKIAWISSRRAKKHWKQNWFLGYLSTLVYSLWEERNCRIFRGYGAPKWWRSAQPGHSAASWGHAPWGRESTGKGESLGQSKRAQVQPGLPWTASPYGALEVGEVSAAAPQAR
ncbi:uncharacterized protein LOC141608449 [Silene latifolia]|uniref:uncharacterized protein LOC141608449 n=1 Tax=Silene latifolia TaxID=37657 RepID=UPI003D77AB75